MLLQLLDAFTEEGWNLVASLDMTAGPGGLYRNAGYDILWESQGSHQLIRPFLFLARILTVGCFAKKYDETVWDQLY